MTFPQEFLQRMQRLCDRDFDEFLNGYQQPLRRGLRVNTRKCAVKHLLSVFPHPLTPSPFCDQAFYLDTPHKAGADPLHHAGAYYMQEPSAASAVTILAPRRGEHILDLCAAPGGKSTQIAAAIGDEGLLWCNEYVRTRAQVLAQNLERLGIGNAVVSNSDTTPLCEQLEGCFDAVLADVPCSGEGMFRKEEVALTQWNESLIAECASRGAQILHNASLAVRPGGRLVYSTCTFAPEENELQIARFLDTHPDFSLADCGVSFGRPAFGADKLKAFDPAVSDQYPLERCRRIFPADGGEGHFIALLIKSGNVERPVFDQRPEKQTAIHTQAYQLWEDCFTTSPKGNIGIFGEVIRMIPRDVPPTKRIPLIYVGLPFATVAKNRLEPHHAAFTATLPQECRQVLMLNLDDPRITAFLHGEEITVDESFKGYTAVAVEGVVCGFGKASRGVLKNRYPKGLRTL